jgi:hypothetical protein
MAEQEALGNCAYLVHLEPFVANDHESFMPRHVGAAVIAQAEGAVCALMG